MAVWVIGNFALGRSLVAETQEGPTSTFSSRTGLTGTGARQNIFIILLASSLVFSVIYTFVFVLGLDVLLNPAIILCGIATILTGVSFALKREMPMSFGFITLAVFLLADGIAALLYALKPDAPLYILYPYIAVISLACAIYFVFQKWVLKNIGFLMLSGYLISAGLSYFFIRGPSRIFTLFSDLRHFRSSCRSFSFSAQVTVTVRLFPGRTRRPLQNLRGLFVLWRRGVSKRMG